jgi:hypothetical protein
VIPPGQGEGIGPGELRRMPVFCQLLEQWRVNRGASEEVSQRAFSRDWEQLLADAGIESAEERAEAIRDAGVLEVAALVTVKRPRARPYQIDRIAIRLHAEPRLRTWFGAEWAVTEKRDLHAVAWAPELAFVPEARLGIALDDLCRLNAFFLEGAHRGEAIPVKERSLQIFGDEKRLDALRGTALFREGRLDLERHLAAFVVAEPLGWRRGPAAAASGPMLVVENAATFDSYCARNDRFAEFSAIIYGGGNRFVDSVSRLSDVFAEIGGVKPVLYFGDIDVPGVRIARRADEMARRLGISPIIPDRRSYRWLLEHGKPSPIDAEESQPLAEADLLWLDDLAGEIAPVLRAGMRIAQEHLHRAFLLAERGEKSPLAFQA